MRAKGPSLSGRSVSGGAGGGGGDDTVAVGAGVGAVGVVALDDREAIRARDERERDLAVQQRRSMDLKAKTDKTVNDSNQQQQHRTHREGQDSARKEAEKVTKARERGRRRRCGLFLLSLLPFDYFLLHVVVGCRAGLAASNRVV